MKKQMTTFLPTIGKLFLVTAFLFNVSCADESVEEIDTSVVNSEELSTNKVNRYAADRPVDGETYMIYNIATSKVLYVENKSHDNGANVQQWKPTGHNNQLWVYKEVDNVFTLTNVNSGKVLEVGGEETAKGSNVNQSAYLNNNWQKWSLEGTDDSSDKIYNFVNEGASKYLEVAGEKTGNGANVQIWTRVTNHDFQKWHFIKKRNIAWITKP